MRADVNDLAGLKKAVAELSHGDRLHIVDHVYGKTVEVRIRVYEARLSVEHIDLRDER